MPGAVRILHCYIIKFSQGLKRWYYQCFQQDVEPCHSNEAGWPCFLPVQFFLSTDKKSLKAWMKVTQGLKRVVLSKNDPLLSGSINKQRAGCLGGRVLGKPLGEWVEELLMAQGSIKPRDTGLGRASHSDMQVSALLSSHHCCGECKGQERQWILMTAVLETFCLAVSKAFSFGFSL